MKSVLDHYEEHLGPVYLWMVGDFDAALERSAAQLDALGITPRHNAVAVDVVPCMGDTLTHLPDLPAVGRLFDAAAAALAKGGVF